MKKITLVVPAIVMVVALIAGSLAAQTVKKTKGTAKQGAENSIAAAYSCPMHPEVTSDKPGKCPECGMFLEKKQAPAKKTAAAPYVCPMHPEATSDKPGKCPECKMKLEKPKTGKSKGCSHTDMQCH